MIKSKTTPTLTRPSQGRGLKAPPLRRGKTAGGVLMCETAIARFLPSKSCTIGFMRFKGRWCCNLQHLQHLPMYAYVGPHLRCFLFEP